ncbi:MAG: DUF711 family protein, partial [Eubacteriales bacterium]
MLNQVEILSTLKMIESEHLDVRTITMGLSLRDCIDTNAKVACDKIIRKITHYAKDLVKTGEAISAEYGIPIVNKRISVTPISLIAEASDADDYVCFAKALDKAAKDVGVDFLGGFSALVEKGFTPGDK